MVAALVEEVEPVEEAAADHKVVGRLQLNQKVEQYWQGEIILNLEFDFVDRQLVEQAQLVGQAQPDSGQGQKLVGQLEYFQQKIQCSSMNLRHSTTK